MAQIMDVSRSADIGDALRRLWETSDEHEVLLVVLEFSKGQLPGRDVVLQLAADAGVHVPTDSALAMELRGATPDQAPPATHGLWVGKLGLLIPRDTDEVVCNQLDLVLRAAHVRLFGEAPGPAGPSSSGVARAMQAVASNVLTVHDLEAVLQSIANTVLHLLDSDICGVFLRDGDCLEMSACAGHLTVETQRLRIRAGQGLAGRVLKTGTACKVDDYLFSDEITRDFTSLAVEEGTKSALGVPLRSRQELVGVLEVWRRQGAAFTDHEVDLLVTLADLASIAIGNARLYEEQRATVHELEQTQRALRQHVERMRTSSKLQQEFLDMLVDGGSDVDVARMIGESLQCQVLLLAASGEPLAAHPGAVDLTVLRSLLADVDVDHGNVVRVEVPGWPDTACWVRRVQAGDSEPLGLVALVGPHDVEDELRLGVGQAAAFLAVRHLAERSAAEARSEARDEILWGLVDTNPRRRAAALDQARRSNLDMTGDHRFVFGVLRDVDRKAAELGWSVTDLDRARRRMQEEVHRITTQRRGHIGTCRGDWILLAVHEGTEQSVTAELNKSIDKVFSGARAHWGVSTSWADHSRLPGRFAEAKTAARAAERLGSDQPLNFSELGVVGVLVSDVDGPEIARFVQDTLQGVLDYDAERGDCALTETLAVYFDQDCSQKEAADALPVHHKTLRYRLERVRELTGLDMTRHNDRQRASIAVEVIKLLGDGVLQDGVDRLRQRRAEA